MAINYTKMHGLKNDFIIIDGREKKISLNSKKIKKISDRKKGLGCDQVVILEKPKKKSALAFVKFYNSDGSKTKACGNAARCVAFLLIKEFKTKKIIIQTEATLLNAFLTKNNQVSVDIGKAYFKWNQIPLKRKINIEEIGINVNFNSITYDAWFILIITLLFVYLLRKKARISRKTGIAFLVTYFTYILLFF